MAIFILGPDSNGNCCECSQRAQVCDSCEEPVLGCSLFIPLFGGVYSDYDFAAADIAVSTYDCYLYTYNHKDSITANVSSPNSIVITGSHSAPLGQAATVDPFSCVTIGAGFISINYNVSGSGGLDGNPRNRVYIYIYDQDGIVLDFLTLESASAILGTYTSINLDAGTYYVLTEGWRVALTSTTQILSTTASFTVSSTSLVPNPVVALWDDSGTTRQLEACPRMLIPVQLAPWGALGNWYAGETEAQTAIDNETVDCLAYCDSGFGVNTASVSGTEFTATLSSGDNFSVRLTWMSVNLEEGETVTISASASATGTCIDGSGPIDGEAAFVTVSLLDYEGNLILNAEDFTVTNQNISVSDSITAPYTGKYYLQFEGFAQQGIGGECNEESISGIFTAGVTSATAELNPVQALYDVGLACAARLDC